MKRTLLVLGMVLALAMTAMANVEPYDSDSEITSPMAGEVVYENTLHLEATYDGETEYPRTGFGVKTTCEPRAGVLVNGTVDDDGSSNILNGDAHILDGPSWDGTDFSATIDVTSWDPGFYCFAFNPGPGGNDRVVQSFYIVDDYVLVDASIDDALDTYAPDTRKPDYSVSGVVGLYGTDSVTGMLEVRYHNPKITCWIDVSTGDWRTGDTGFDADSILDFAGVDNADYMCNNGDEGTFGSVFFLDPATTAVPGWPGGAVVIDEDGDRTTSGTYDLIGELDTSFYWVPLDRGEAYFNIW